MDDHEKNNKGESTSSKSSGIDMFALTRTLLSVHGMWPFDNSKLSYIKNVIVAVSLFLHVPFVFLMLNKLEDFGIVRRIILHLIATMVTIPMQFLIRFHPTIKHAMKVMMLCANEGEFRSKQEKALYVAEIRHGLFVQKITGMITSMLLATVLLKPTMKIPMAIKDPGNATKYITPMFPVFVAPLRSSNCKYFSFYASELIIFYTFFCRFVPCTFIALTMAHVAGQCARISHRIENMKYKSENAIEELGRIVNIHVNSKQLALSVFKVFSVLTMVDVFSSAAGLALTTHRVVTRGHSSSESSDSLPFFITYCTALLTLLLVYHYIGQNVLNATRSYREAIYLCDWHSMPSNVQSSILICMLGAEKTVELRVGGFYCFSLATFADLIKTTVGYVSALSALV